MKGLKNFIVLEILCFLIDSIYGDALSRHDDFNLETQLRIINKAPVKTIHTKYGDVDCIDVYKQPAFDHPLLRNHSLQRKPSILLDGVGRKTSTQYNRRQTSFPILHGCPKGTVPIRRTTRGDLIRERYHQKIPAKDHIGYVSISYKVKLYGTKATIDIYNPQCGPGQLSTGGIRLVDAPSSGGPPGYADLIEVGWMVNPDLYGDTSAHFYTQWATGNPDNKGCYDIRCAGFVQVATDIVIGGAFENVSIYNGLQYETSVQVYQDNVTFDWWLVNYDEPIGYWPKELFDFFHDGASKISYGGHVNGPIDQPSPPMGSGYFPDESLVHSCYIREIVYLTSWRQLYHPSGTTYETDAPACYGVADLGYLDDQMEYTVQFGGPGGTGC